MAYNAPEYLFSMALGTCVSLCCYAECANETLPGYRYGPVRGSESRGYTLVKTAHSGEIHGSIALACPGFRMRTPRPGNTGSGENRQRSGLRRRGNES